VSDTEKSRCVPSSRRECQLDFEKELEMSRTAVNVGEIVRRNGTVEDSEKVNLPAGKVQVTLFPLSKLSPDDPFCESMHKIWGGPASTRPCPAQW
jgi:hypothetical protein